MHNRELVLEVLGQIYDSTQKVLKRFEPIKSANNFTDSESGMEKLAQVIKKIMKEVQENQN